MGVLVRVRPEQVAEKPGVRNICWSHDSAHLLHVRQLGRETAVHAENLLINDRAHWKAVEAVGESLPELDVVAPLALIVEAIDAVDRSALMIAAKKEEVLRVLDLVGEQEADRLQ